MDTSKHGLGANISENDNVFGYASRALNKTEQNYAQLDKELIQLFMDVNIFIISYMAEKFM